MRNPLPLILCALAYLALTFAPAWMGDKKHIARDHCKIQAATHPLCVAVHCTSWTLYGAVGSAATTGRFLPVQAIFLRANRATTPGSQRLA